MVSSLAKFLEYSARDNNVYNVKNVTLPFVYEWKALAKRIDASIPAEESEQQSAGIQESDIQKVVEQLTVPDAGIAEMDIDAADEIVILLEKEGLGSLDAAVFAELKLAVENIEPDRVNELCDKFG